MATFRHLLMIRFDEDVTRDQKEELLKAFARMPAEMGFIRRYEFGFDLGNLGPGSPDFGLVADFDSEEDWRRYSTNPEHDSLAGLVRDVAAELIRLQYLVD